jgi:putative DNA methylase
MPSYPKRLIEVDLPIARISAHARREKSIRHGHISTLHIWWARRPLAACRAVICAALWPDPGERCPPRFRSDAIRLIIEFAKKVTTTGRLMDSCSPESFARWEALAAGTLTLDPEQKADWGMLRLALLDFIADFANWDNSTVPEYLETARALTQSAHESLGGEPGTRPLVVDPFAGGGSIPLEALRVGADAFASDLNPVAVLLNKVVLEYIPKYGQRLADEVRKWGQWIKAEAEKELAEFYPKDPDGAMPIAYLWARTVLSEAPDEGLVPVEIPLLRSMWLAKKPSRKVALRWLRDKEGNVQTETVEVTYSNGTKSSVRRPLMSVFEPRSADDVENGTSAGGKATCPVTGFTMPVEAVRTQLLSRSGGAADSRLISVVSVLDCQHGRRYRIPVDHDHAAFRAAYSKLNKCLSEAIGGRALVPDEKLNHLRGFFNVILYGMTTWGDVFTPRQKLILVTLVRLVNQVGEKTESISRDLAESLQTCLAFVVSRMADGNSSLASWQNTGEKIGHTFGRQALPMIWDYSEANPFCSATRSLDSMFEWIAKVVEHEACNPVPGRADQMSATAHILPDDSVDAVITDPPYYAAIPYADLSDFFYTWLTRMLRSRHPSVLATTLTPKDDECVALSHRAAMYRNKNNSWFERMMTRACAESRRITRPHGVSVFVFASKEAAAWEAMLQALIDGGWIITASWPIDTEMGTRLRAMNSATLASSIHIIGRPRESNGASVGEGASDWRDVLSALPRRIHEWLPRLAQEGIVGADAIFACLGPALEIFSRYSRVEKASGETVTLREYLEHVWAAVSTEALSLIMKNADAAGMEPDARLTAMWLWTLGGGNQPTNGSAKTGDDETDQAEESADEEDKGTKPGKVSGFTLEYDAARMIAQGLGIDLEKSDAFVEVKGDKARLLPVAERSRRLFGKETEASSGGRKKKKVQQKSLFEEAAEADGETGWGEIKGPLPGATALDRLHQAMILFGAQRGELLKRFLVEDGVGKDARFWKLAQSLSALYPVGSDEKRWVDGVLARKKGLGL